MDKKCSGCGKEYWRNQQWIHDKCEVVLVVNTLVVNKRTLDRHQKTEARKRYQLEWMRKKRASNSVDG